MSNSKILVVEDDAGLREALVDTLQLAGYNCIEADSGEAALLTLKEHKVDIVVSDVQMGGMSGLSLLKSIKANWPNLPVLIMTAYGTIDDAVQAMRDGACNYMAKPFSPEVLLNMVSQYVPSQVVDRSSPVVADARSLELLKLAKKVASTDASVMILGPSGSGKEVLSQYVHYNSARAEQPFVAINCAAIPENMLEATLFGYEKGAFTGAVQACPGKFEQAQGGTILLDEITEMDLGLQAKILRVLQEREVERLAGRKTIKLDVRVIATSNRDLKVAVQEGVFREDLYYRLNVFPLTWLPLAQRKDDIIPLAKHLVSRICQKNGDSIPEFSESACAKLYAHAWPGNVRELDNVVQRALILHSNGLIDESDLLIEHFGQTETPVAQAAPIQHVPAQHTPVAHVPVSNVTAPNMPVPNMPMQSVPTEQNGNIVYVQQPVTPVPSNVDPNAAQSSAAVVNTFAEQPAAVNQTPSQPSVKTGEENLGNELKQQEHQIILDTLNACRGSRKDVAERLGISPRTLRYKLARMRDSGIQIPA